MKKKEIFIVGKITGTKDPLPWDFQGVFSTKEKAEAVCKDHNYFIGPAIMDKELPDESINWPGAYFPKSEKILI